MVAANVDPIILAVAVRDGERTQRRRQRRRPLLQLWEQGRERFARGRKLGGLGQQIVPQQPIDQLGLITVQLLFRPTANRRLDRLREAAGKRLGEVDIGTTGAGGRRVERLGDNMETEPVFIIGRRPRIGQADLVERGEAIAHVQHFEVHAMSHVAAHIAALDQPTPGRAIVDA